MAMSILVIGATGTIGKEVIKQLTTLGIPVRALVHSPEKAASIAGPGVEAVIGDLGKPETIEAAMHGITKVFLNSPSDLQKVAWESNVIQSAKRAGITHIVKISALGVSPDSPLGIARQHAQIQQELSESGIAYTVLQPHSFMQNLLANASTIVPNAVFYAPMRDGKIGIVDARDIAAVAVAALTESGHENQIYVITGPEALSYSDLAEKFSKVLGKPVTYVNVPPEAARQAMVASGMPEWLADDLLGLMGVFAAGQAAIVTNTVAEVTHKQPISFEQFVIDYQARFRA
ncbi:NAD(P)-dependent oxidoreductase [Dictyobacter vulcani]|uniref:NAD(P)-dependent oxidoreductase n=1 Tax=Dictyobacter vulcani TaxID=2607529 RepID=A0A5J4L0A2_9CHLR|nr:SDR family oxidoreductase [Dictyobacter vulcani]GER92187.1 NAD(P)-dependent oxidoreductase [Dictyobacter vulcani]